jgi:Short C-terminal domain
MGLFFRPRRPLLRLAAGAATAGIAYKAGQRRAEQDAYNQQATEASVATQAPPPQPAYAPPPPPPPAPAAAPPPDAIAELERLARLHESGALTDEEFTAAKVRALGL